jgi:hypothetical protein
VRVRVRVSIQHYEKTGSTPGSFGRIPTILPHGASGVCLSAASKGTDVALALAGASEPGLPQAILLRVCPVYPQLDNKEDQMPIRLKQ